MQKLALIVDGRPDTELDLTQDLKEIAKKKFVIKEGIKFRIRIDFVVQREIVTGLRYVQKTSRLGVTVDKMKYMVGSYAPKATPHSYTTPYEDAPTGMAGRGSYHVTSFFTDDDQHNHLKVCFCIVCCSIEQFSFSFSLSKVIIDGSESA